MLSVTLATKALATAGWRFEGEVPSVPKYVCLAVPHTSNWDGLLLLLIAQSIQLPMAWMIKKSWMRGPIGDGLRKLGAVAIDRSRRTNLVEQMVEEFSRREKFVLVIPPEGTRAKTTHWKSGFYNIALAAKVPVVPSYLDYSRRRAGFGPPITLTGNIAADMDRIRGFYASTAPGALHPEQVGPILLRSEDELVSELPVETPAD